MSTLQAEWRRLYLPAQAPTPNAASTASEAPRLMRPDGRVRAMVLELARPADWNALATVWQGVQAELELPAPAIAINGQDGYQLWFSLAEPVPTAQAQQFLEGLRQHYLGDIAPPRIRLLPTADQHADMVPTLQAPTGMWSAFVAPDLAAIFADSPGLDVCPSPDAQAKVLSRLACIAPAGFARVLDRFAPGAARQGDAPPDHPSDPRLFLQEVMNDPGIAMALRIEAAKALLPYS